MSSRQLFEMDYSALVEHGIDTWNQWRASHRGQPCDLSGQDLSHGYFFEADFSGVTLKGANLQRACLIGADLSNADLRGADLRGAYLGDANLYGADLSYADFSQANLDRADLRGTILIGTRLSEAELHTARLPDPNLDPYVELVAQMLAAHRMANQPDSARAVATKKLVRRSLLQQMADQLQQFARESPQAAALRAQAVRQSAVLPAPTGQRTAAASQKTDRRRTDRQIDRQTGPEVSYAQANGQQGHSVAIAPPVATEGSLPRRRLAALSPALSPALKPSLSSAAVGVAQRAPRAPQKPSTRKHSRRAHRNQAIPEKALGRSSSATPLSTRTQPRPLWLPAAIGGLLLTIGLPAGFMALRSRQVSTEATEPQARLLDDSSHRWEVATHHQSADRSWVIGGGVNGQIEVWEGRSGQLIRILEGHRDGVRALAMSASGHWLVSSSSDGLKVWHPQSGELVYSLPEVGTPVASIEISPDETTFISRSDSGTTTQWQLATGDRLYGEKEQPIWSIASNLERSPRSQN